MIINDNGDYHDDDDDDDDTCTFSTIRVVLQVRRGVDVKEFH